MRAPGRSGCPGRRPRCSPDRRPPVRDAAPPHRHRRRARQWRSGFRPPGRSAPPAAPGSGRTAVPERTPGVRARTAPAAHTVPRPRCSPPGSTAGRRRGRAGHNAHRRRRGAPAAPPPSPPGRPAKPPAPPCHRGTAAAETLPPPAARPPHPLRSRPVRRHRPTPSSPSRRPPSARRRPGTARRAGPVAAAPGPRPPPAPPAPPRRARVRRGAAFPWGGSSRRTAGGGRDRPRPRRCRDATPARRPPGSPWEGRPAAWFQPIRAAPTRTGTPVSASSAA